MAEILITGMEMPKEGFTRIMLWPDGGVAIEVSLNNYEQLDDKAIEVPPHGDLIERSSVYKVLDDRIDFYKEAGDDDNACNIVCVEGDIVAIPTIIGASKERE